MRVTGSTLELLLWNPWDLFHAWVWNFQRASRRSRYVSSLRRLKTTIAFSSSLEVDVSRFHVDSLVGTVILGACFMFMCNHSLIGKWFLQDILLGLWCIRRLRGFFHYLWLCFHELLVVRDKQIMMIRVTILSIDWARIIGPYVGSLPLFRRVIILLVLFTRVMVLLGRGFSPFPLLLVLLFLTFLPPLILRIRGIRGFQLLKLLILLLKKRLD